MADRPNDSPAAPAETFPRRLRRHLQLKTVSGLMELLPLLVTILVVVFIVDYADGFLRPLFAHIPAHIPVIGSLDFPGIGIIAIVLLFYLVGVTVSTAAGRRAIDLKSSLLKSLPVVGTIYGVTEQAASVMSSEYRFSRVVFIEWPRTGMIAMGFVTGRGVCEDSGKSIVAIYIPTVPNPTSGNMAFVIEDDVIETDITVEDAMKMVFSGGLVAPASTAFARLPRDPDDDEFIGRFNAAPPH